MAKSVKGEQIVHTHVSPRMNSQSQVRIDFRMHANSTENWCSNVHVPKMSLQTPEQHSKQPVKRNVRRSDMIRKQ